MAIPRRQTGVAIIELAVALPVLILIVFGITEFGRAIYQYDTLAKAARDAARFYAVRDPSDPVSIAQTKCMAVYGNPSCTGNALAIGLTASMVAVCWAGEPACAATHELQGTAPPINLISVTIGGPDTPYTFVSAIPFVVSDIPFNAISATMRAVL